jgi:hypothetical protein
LGKYTELAEVQHGRVAETGDRATPTCYPFSF